MHMYFISYYIYKAPCFTVNSTLTIDNKNRKIINEKAVLWLYQFWILPGSGHSRPKGDCQLLLLPSCCFLLSGLTLSGMTKVPAMAVLGQCRWPMCWTNIRLIYSIQHIKNVTGSTLDEFQCCVPSVCFNVHVLIPVFVWLLAFCQNGALGFVFLAAGHVPLDTCDELWCSFSVLIFVRTKTLNLLQINARKKQHKETLNYSSNNLPIDLFLRHRNFFAPSSWILKVRRRVIWIWYSMTGGFS